MGPAQSGVSNNLCDCDMSSWPPVLPANGTWADVVALQLLPWSRRGRIDVHKFIRDTQNLRAMAHPPSAALVDTEGYVRIVKHLGASWKSHHTMRARAVLNLFRLAKARANDAGRSLPRISFVLVLSDGHGVTAKGFNSSGCRCTTEANCCDPHVDVMPNDAPAAPSFSTLFCRHAYDVSVPTIIDDLLDTSSEGSIARSLNKWVAMGEAHPWRSRIAKAFFVGDDKAYRPAVLRHGRVHAELLDTHRAVSTDPTHRLPFAEHARYKATVYAHGYHFNSVRWRRLALLGGAVLAAEGPCKEWWQMLARPGVHYEPVEQTFTDLPAAAARLLGPRHDERAWSMATALKALGQRALGADGLLDYIDTLWRAYAALQQQHKEETGEPPPTAPSTTRTRALTLQVRREASASHAPNHGWRCTGWPSQMAGSDEARCLAGNRADGYAIRVPQYEYAHNANRGMRAALCKGACTCCRRERASLSSRTRGTEDREGHDSL